MGLVSKETVVLRWWDDKIRTQQDNLVYNPTAQGRVQITLIYVYRKCVQLVILYCKKTCLTGRLRTLRFSIHFAFPALLEMSGKTWQKKKAVGS